MGRRSAVEEDGRDEAPQKWDELGSGRRCETSSIGVRNYRRAAISVGARSGDVPPKRGSSFLLRGVGKPGQRLESVPTGVASLHLGNYEL